MPIIAISSFSPEDPTVIPPMLAGVRDAGAAALRCPPSNIWVVFQARAPGHYVHGEETALHPGDTSHPPIVEIKAQAGRTDADKTALTAAVASVVALSLGISPRNVWIHYQEMRPRDVWFEGRWAEE